MFESLTENKQNAISILKDDHNKVKGLFEQFEKADSVVKKKKIAAEVIMELKIHATIEEEIFYATVRKPTGKKIMNEADEEHHVAKFLIAELERMTGKEDHYDAKFTVLAENVRHHIKEEEGQMFPKVRSESIDLDKLGQKMLARKARLKKTGVAVFAEEKLVRSFRGKADSPVQAAKTKRPLKLAQKSRAIVKSKKSAA